MGKATPGPWGAKGFRVCANVNPGDPPIKVICDTANNKASRNPENAANARLIAAAPDLLAACEVAEAFVAAWAGHYAVAYELTKSSAPGPDEWHPEHKAAMEMILAAIAKATQPGE